jgi:two-component system chemotaxis sensor kinase CheA
MGETSNESTHLSAGIDLSQFYQVFFEEAGENLETMEQMLLNLDIENADEEELNAIFRCAHSVKGGAATFGFSDVAELTHQMETLLDKLRRHELSPTTPMVDVLLASGDALKAQLGRHQGSGADPVDTSELLRSIRALVEGGSRRWRWRAPPAATRAGRKPCPLPRPAPAAPAAAAPAKPGLRHLELTVGPLPDPDRPTTWWSCSRKSPTWAPSNRWTPAALPTACAASRSTTSSDNDLLDLFGFHVSREHVRLAPLGPGYGFHPGRTGCAGQRGTRAQGRCRLRFLRRCPRRAGLAHPHPTELPQAAWPHPPPNRPAAAACRTRRPRRKGRRHHESSTLRVSVDKVDQLINLVGELVITQAMLAQNSKGVDAALYQQMASGLTDLERNTRDLQEAVMSIRMIPMSLVFNRFPRMMRDLAGKLGKKVELVQVGEATELDKGLVEKITDPLTHLVRNSCDHGIEMPAERIAKGKPEHGTITLIASHQGGSIVIEVRDDGKGLNRAKLLKKARERGMDVHDAMTDQEVYA